jgi:hypothetical protein
MKRLGVIVAILCLPSISLAGDYVQGTTRGKNTYYDDGTVLHRTPGGGIVTYDKTGKSGPSYSRHGSTLWGSDGSKRLKTKNGVDSRLKTEPTVRDRAVDEIFGSDDW